MKLAMLTRISILVLALALSGCTSSQRQDVGIAGGAVAGGIIGNAVTGGSAAGTIVGAGAGALGGNYLAK